MRRTFDIVVSILGLALLLTLGSPLLLLHCLVLVFVSRGPLLYRQKRIGYGGQPFTILKIRTMKWQPHTQFARCNGLRDPRIIWGLGHILRYTRFDEIPQFINVLEGTMSIFGPRPYEVSMDEHYAKTIPGYTGRYRVKPGMASLSKFLSRHNIEKEVRLDARRYSKGQPALEPTAA